MRSYKQSAIANTGLEPVNPRSRILCLTIWLIRNLVLHNRSTERGILPPRPKDRAQNDYERHSNVIAEMSESHSHDQLHSFNP